MKFYKSFYAVVIGIATLPFCAWGMEKSMIQTQRFFSEQPSQPESDIFTQSGVGSVFEKKDHDYDNFKINCQNLVESLNELEEIFQEEKHSTLDILAEEKKKSIIKGLSSSMDFIIRRDKSVKTPQESLRIQSLNEIKEALGKKNLSVNPNLIKQWKNSIANSCRFTIDNIEKIKMGESTETLERSSVSPLFVPQEIKQAISISKQEKIDSLKEQTTKLKEDSSKYRTYKTIIDDLEVKLKSNKLTSADIKVIYYTIKMVNRTPITIIIKEINEEPISLKSKIYILIKLSTLPRLSIPLEAKLVATREAGKTPVNQLKPSKLQAEWSKKKIQLKQELEQKIIQNYKDQDIEIEFDELRSEFISLKRWENYKKALILYNNILDKNDPLKKEIEKKIQHVEKSIEEKIQKTQQIREANAQIREANAQIAEKKRKTKELELTLAKQTTEIQTKRKNNENISLDELKDYKNNLEKYIEELGRFTGEKAQSEKEKRTRDLQLISQRIETIKREEERQLQELIEQRAQKKTQEIQQQRLLQQEEEFENLKNQLLVFNNTHDLHVPKWIAENMSKVIELKNVSPNKEAIEKLFQQYKNILYGKAKDVLSYIKNIDLSLQQSQINASFPADNNEFLAPYRREALENLTSAIVNNLNLKNIGTYEEDEKQSAIKNIILLADNIAYLPEDKKALFNQRTSNLNILLTKFSYNRLASGLKDSNQREDLKKALETIKNAVGYKQWEALSVSEVQKQPIQSTQPTNQIVNVEEPTNQQIISTQSTQVPTNTTSTTTTISTQPTITDTIKIEQNIQDKKQQLEKEKQNLEEKVKQQQEELQSLKSQNTGILATIGQAIGGFFRAIANGVSSAVSYILSLFSGS